MLQATTVYTVNKIVDISFYKIVYPDSIPFFKFYKSQEVTHVTD